MSTQQLLRHLPGVDTLLLETDHIRCGEDLPKNLRTRIIRQVLEAKRRAILEGRLQDISTLEIPRLIAEIHPLFSAAIQPNLRRVINATGVVVHTNMGRSLLAEEALQHILSVANHYSNLELNLDTGKRGLRYTAVSSLLTEITGAEAAMVVNNNAAAVLLCLDTLTRNKEAIVSRGELVEIGGSFRIPDVMTKSGAILKEVGTTNRTHLQDYETAISEKTGLLLKVHTSNFQIMGFTASVSMKDLAALGRKHGIPVMDDLGSGSFIDFSPYGLTKEPTVQESLEAGADIVTFSGDKLLGGPQAGIIVGKKSWIETIRSNPLTRALRIDKLILAALEGTLRLYRDPAKALTTIPTLRMLTLSENACIRKAQELQDQLRSLSLPAMDIRIQPSTARAGGGSLPTQDLPSRCVVIRCSHLSAAALERQLRSHTPPIMGRVEEDSFLMDVRTLQEEETAIIVQAFATLFSTLSIHERPQKETP
ncbi:L-seryl-tRNA(Sec) selenium transferase [Desulfobotulus sp. H1]|uniref:L-seryl-tRNA(Sec) selenium transferase n=1 Tax=Desulfobotulus pelophilus TaxID=2823377 RepID=A0ABT3N616_9BACT|nr:L-seryl-tRNA(Sec) selenium transferase [Desulfobotulus pelophilus]MCW7752477.1 L-seryl-tRNA(Sec) selenium transferase [Desulfobotulus pelophilus]